MNDLPPSIHAPRKLTLAVDIGGSHLKAGIVDPSGTLLGRRERIKTPDAAPASQVVAALVELAGRLGPFDRISIGFPGVVRNGRVLTAPHLGTKAWQGFPLAAEIERALARPVRMLNDATVQGLGAITGQGIELVLTLGTGMGFALFTDGRLAPHLEMSQHPARKNETYDDYIGDAARERIGRRHWNRRVHRVIATLRTVVGYDLLYIGGGNARRIDPPWPGNVLVVSNETGVTGGVRLWDRRLDAMFEESACAFEALFPSHMTSSDRAE